MDTTYEEELISLLLEIRNSDFEKETIESLFNLRSRISPYVLDYLYFGGPEDRKYGEYLYSVRGTLAHRIVEMDTYEIPEESPFLIAIAFSGTLEKLGVIKDLIETRRIKRLIKNERIFCYFSEDQQNDLHKVKSSRKEKQIKVLQQIASETMEQKEYFLGLLRQSEHVTIHDDEITSLH